MSEPTPGKFCWNELITPDPEAAKKFYGELFGWEADDMPMGEMTYTMFKPPGASSPEDMVGGMVQSPMPDMPPHWLSYVAVDDVAATLGKAAALGATVVTEVTELPMGTLAVFTDPQGAAFAIWKKRE